MSYREIMAAIEGYKARQKYEQEMQAAISFEHAHLLGSIISRILGSKKDPPSSPQKAFKSVFGEVTSEQGVMRQQDWRIMKERVADRAEVYRKRGESNGNDTGRIANPDHSRNETTE